MERRCAAIPTCMAFERVDRVEQGIHELCVAVDSREMEGGLKGPRLTRHGILKHTQIAFTPGMGRKGERGRVLDATYHGGDHGAFVLVFELKLVESEPCQHL